MRQLLVYAVRRLNRRVAAGSITRLVKVKSHRAEPLNAAADALASAAAELDPSRPIDLDPEAVYFYLGDTPVEWDARLKGHLVQIAAKQSREALLRSSASGPGLMDQCRSQPRGCSDRFRAGARWVRCFTPFSPALRSGAFFRS